MPDTSVRVSRSCAQSGSAVRFVATASSLALLALTGCSAKETACKDAVRAALKNPPFFRIEKVKDEYGEGAAFNSYTVYYSYKLDGEQIKGNKDCLFDNNDGKAYTEIPEPRF